jgi:hypothetical protein
MKPILIAALLLPGLASAQPPPPRADHSPAIRPPALNTACDDPDHRRFDFWVGRWNVSPTGQPKVVAHSLIESLYDGCAIRENWMPIGQQAGGGSLSGYVAAERAWRQTWVDSSGSRAEFKGGWNGAAMVLTGPWPLADGRARTVRMTYTPNPDGSVRQAGEDSFDGGRSWKPSFDFTYRRAPTPAAPFRPR